MLLASKNVVQNLLKAHNIRPAKRFGQNFLIDNEVVEKIIETGGIKPDDIVLEIGPGLGVLTQGLAKAAKEVIAVEKDKNMVAILKETMKDSDNIKIIQADILKIPGYQLPVPRQTRDGSVAGYKLIGNLPFYLTAPLVRKFLEIVPGPKLMALVVQKEVAQRICAKPPKMNLLAVSVQIYAEPKIIAYVSQNSFWPSPEVDAAIIKIAPAPLQKNLQESDLYGFFKIVKAGFAQPRKQLINNLSRGLKIDKSETRERLEENGIKPSQRAETLTISDWINLTKGFKIKQ